MKKHWLKLGFTLIEILCVLIIIWIIVGFSTIKIKDSQKKARDMIRKNDLQVIADALISYHNDYGHFPSSIYDENIPGKKIISVSDAWRKITDSWADFKFSWNKLFYIPSKDTYKNYYGMSEDDLNNGKFFQKTDAGGFGDQMKYEYIWENSSKFWDKNSEKYNNMEQNINKITDELIIPTDFDADGAIEFAVVTQWMCISELKQHLVDNWYLSKIPNDPSWEELNLETNYCIKAGITLGDWVNANSNMNISKNDCYAKGNSGCAKLCKEWYAYVSDWNHFALIAHMESKNAWNYITTACGSCGSGCNSENKPTRTDTEQLPCDIIDEFTNTFDCIQNTWVVEYNTWEYYFYIY